MESERRKSRWARVREEEKEREEGEQEDARRERGRRRIEGGEREG